MHGDLISRQSVLEMAYDMSEIDGEHFTEPCMVVDVEDIQNLPSVNPQEPKADVLDKIRAEIDAHRKTIKDMADTDDWFAGKLSGHDCDIEIIDKHKAESEEV